MNTTNDLLSTYTRHQQTRGFSPATIRRRTVSISALARWITPLDLQNATTDLIEEWLGTFPRSSTRRAYRADLAAFYGWAVRRQLVTRNPMDAIDPVRVPKALPRPIAAHLIPTIIATADPLTATIIALAAYAGLRRTEIANLDGDDICGQPTLLIVRDGKGGKDRAIPLHPELAKIIGRPHSGRVVPLSSAQIGRRASEHLRSYGIDATLHQARHTFGTEAARASRGDLLVVGELMGHQSPSTTIRYTQLLAGRTHATVAAMFDTAA